MRRRAVMGMSRKACRGVRRREGRGMEGRRASRGMSKKRLYMNLFFWQSVCLALPISRNIRIPQKHGILMSK
jgi:hypothetical protein